MFGIWRRAEGTPDIGLPDEERLYNTGLVPIEVLHVQLRWLQQIAAGLLRLRTAKS